jgi:hypothetical protein
LLDFLKNDSIKELLDKIKNQNNTQLVMENLDEGLLSFGIKGF